MRSSTARRTRRWVTSIVLAVSVASIAPHAVASERPLAPTLEARTGKPVTNSVTNLLVRITQNDGTEPIQHHTITLPPWRFAVGSVTTAGLTSCSEITSPQHAANNMEAMGLATVTLHTDTTRQQFADDNNDGMPDGGTGGVQSHLAGPGPARFFGQGSTASIWFLGWDSAAASATLCGVVTTGSPRVPFNHRTLVFEIELRLQPDGSWVMTFDLDRATGVAADNPNPRSVTDNPYFLTRNVSVTEFSVDLSGLSGGNWNLQPDGTRCRIPPGTPGNQYHGFLAPCQVAFSQTPRDPGDYEVEGDFVAVCPSGGASCPRATRTVPLPITDGVTTIMHEFARLTGPAGPAQIPPRFALVRGTSQITFSWQQPPVAPSSQVKGYLLVIARPGDQASRHMEYMITDPTHPSFDEREPCGDEGSQEGCSLTLSFPLGTIGGKPLLGDGKYDAALVTIYSSSGGGLDRRTDGRCDDGTIDGSACPAGEPALSVVNPGVSSLEFLIRADSWPVASVVNSIYIPTGGGLPYQGPDLLLLVDFGTRRAQFIRWRPWSPSETFTAPSNQIIGDNQNGGVVSFGSPAGMFIGPTWRFDGVVARGQTIGSFEVVDWNAFPASNGMPSHQHRLFRGTNL